MGALKAGAHETIITPIDSQFLYGYPHVERYSTGVHDDLIASALYLADGSTEIMFVAHDLIFVDKKLSRLIRQDIERETGIPASHVMITATHTHSGPVMNDYASSVNDPVVPLTDKAYLALVREKSVAAALEAYRRAVPAVIGMSMADSTGIGTNRRDPAGPANHDVPVLTVMDVDRKTYLACMMIGSMHPTVLHEDSTLISGDFPGMAKKYLKDNVMGQGCVMLYHNGPCGNQSPRHVVSGTTFSEAERLGAILGSAVEKTLGAAVMTNDIELSAVNALLDDMPRKEFPKLADAEAKLARLVKKMEQMKADNEPRAEIRTLECDIFGAEEVVTLSKMAADGSLEPYYQECLPAEVQILSVGPWNFAGWSGEVFVEYGLAIKGEFPGTFVISLANGDFQGYIVTPEAAAEGGYEASNAMFTPEAGKQLVETTRNLLT